MRSTFPVLVLAAFLLSSCSDAGHVDRLQCVNAEGEQVTDLYS